MIPTSYMGQLGGSIEARVDAGMLAMDLVVLDRQQQFQISVIDFISYPPISNLVKFSSSCGEAKSVSF